MIVLPNDHHILHLMSHQPDIETDLTNLESAQGNPQQLLQVVQLKIKHIADHLQTLVPDVLQEQIVAEMKRKFNNESERVEKAIMFAQRQAAKAQAQAQSTGTGTAPSEGEQAAQANAQKMQQDHEAHGQKLQQDQEAHAQKMKHDQEKHQFEMQKLQEDAKSMRAIKDAEAAASLREKMQKPVAAAA